MLKPTGWLGFLSDLDLKTKLLDSGPPLRIPLPDDFPEIGFLTARQVVEEFAQFKASGVGEEGDEFADARQELMQHMSKAAKLKLGLVTFTY